MATRSALFNRNKDWRLNLAAAIWTATAMMAVVVVSRRLGSHFPFRMSAGPTTIVAAVLMFGNMLAAGLMRSTYGSRRVDRAFQWRAVLAVGLVTLGSPLAVGVAILPAGSITGLSSLAALCLISATIMLVAGDALTFPPSPATTSPAQEMFGQPVRTGEDRDNEDDNDPEFASEADKSDGLLPLLDSTADEGEGECAASQWMSRTDRPDGSLQIEGAVTLHFLPGQQTAVIHVPFFPPLNRSPKVSCHLLDDHPVRLRVTFTKPYGTRVEAKRTGDVSAAESVAIGYLAVTEAAQSEAA